MGSKSGIARNPRTSFFIENTPWRGLELLYGNDKSREREVKPENQIIRIRNFAAAIGVPGSGEVGRRIPNNRVCGAPENVERHEGQTSRYQGTLMTTIRWLPRSKRSAFKTEARLLWNRW